MYLGIMTRCGHCGMAPSLLRTPVWIVVVILFVPFVIALIAPPRRRRRQKCLVRLEKRPSHFVDTSAAGKPGIEDGDQRGFPRSTYTPV